MKGKPISQLNKSQLRDMCNDLNIAFEDEDSKKVLIEKVTVALEKIQATEPEPRHGIRNPEPKENRGRKPKELCIEDIRNEAKELIVHLRTLVAAP